MQNEMVEISEGKTEITCPRCGEKFLINLPLAQIKVWWCPTCYYYKDVEAEKLQDISMDETSKVNDSKSFNLDHTGKPI